MLMGDVRAEQLIRDIEPEILATLTPAQESAIRAAARRDAWKTHAVDIRLSLPSPLGRFYITLVAGRDKRSAARRRADRAQHPLNSIGNVCFAAGGTVIVGALVVTAASFLGLI